MDDSLQNWTTRELKNKRNALQEQEEQTLMADNFAMSNGKVPAIQRQIRDINTELKRRGKS